MQPPPPRYQGRMSSAAEASEEATVPSGATAFTVAPSILGKMCYKSYWVYLFQAHIIRQIPRTKHGKKTELICFGIKKCNNGFLVEVER